MKTCEVKLYTIDELSDEAREKAINNNYGTNVEHFEWWDSTYEDAAQVGIKITSFDIDRASYCNASIDDVDDTALKILDQHGETCETYSTAKNALEDKPTPFKQCESDENECMYAGSSDWDSLCIECQADYEYKIETWEKEFAYAIGEDYRIILKHQYEYLTSEDAVLESLRANEDQFTNEGLVH